MTLPGAQPETGGPIGHTYAALLVRAKPASFDALVAALRGIRFSGWVAPPDDEWIVVVAYQGDGTVASGRRGVLGVGALVAERLATTVLAVRVLVDRQLVIVAWSGSEELGRYSSDPSREPGADDEVMSEPMGVEYAEAFATAAGRPEVAEKLADELEEELDTDSVYESERLARVLRLLGLPSWLVAAASLPRDIPTGPRSKDLMRLGAGSPGVGGVLLGRAADVKRRRTPPPPAIADPPRMDGSGRDPWLS